jgi:hypothetical protein
MEDLGLIQGIGDEKALARRRHAKIYDLVHQRCGAKAAVRGVGHHQETL